MRPLSFFWPFVLNNIENVKVARATSNISLNPISRQVTDERQRKVPKDFPHLLSLRLRNRREKENEYDKRYPSKKP